MRFPFLFIENFLWVYSGTSSWPLTMLLLLYNSGSTCYHLSLTYVRNRCHPSSPLCPVLSGHQVLTFILFSPSPLPPPSKAPLLLIQGLQWHPKLVFLPPGLPLHPVFHIAARKLFRRFKSDTPFFCSKTQTPCPGIQC